jgi:hypothetical protein
MHCAAKREFPPWLANPFRIPSAAAIFTSCPEFRARNFPFYHRVEPGIFVAEDDEKRLERLLQLLDACVRDFRGAKAQFPKVSQFFQFLEPCVRHLSVPQIQDTQILERLEFFQPQVRDLFRVGQIQFLKVLQFLQFL